MKEKRLLRVIYLCAILVLGILCSMYASSNAQVLPLIPPPVTSSFEAVFSTPVSFSALNSTFYADFLTQYGSKASTYANPFMSTSYNEMFYRDIVSTAAAKSINYSNFLGMNYQAGQGFYMDPLVFAQGSYKNVSTPNAGFFLDQASIMTPVGISSHISSTVAGPWWTYGTSIDRTQGTALVPSIFGAMPVTSAGVNVSHISTGQPTMVDVMTGPVSPHLRGVLLLGTYGPELSAMNQAVGWGEYAVTKEGMLFIPNYSYYNEANPTGWYFAPDASNYQAGITTSPMGTSAYETVTELTGLGLPVTGISAFRFPAGEVASGATGGAAAGVYTPSAYGGWVGSAGTSGITSGAAFGLSGGSTWSSSAGWAGAGGAGVGVGGGAVAGGFVSGTGSSYGGVSGLGWGGGGVSMGGGMVGGGSMGGGFSGGGFSGGFGGGGSMGGGSYGGAPGAGFGGAPGGGGGMGGGMGGGGAAGGGGV